MEISFYLLSFFFFLTRRPTYLAADFARKRANVDPRCSKMQEISPERRCLTNVHTYIVSRCSRTIATRVSKSAKRCPCGCTRVNLACARLRIYELAWYEHRVECGQKRGCSQRRVELVVYSESLWHRRHEFFTHG